MGCRNSCSLGAKELMKTRHVGNCPPDKQENDVAAVSNGFLVRTAVYAGQ